MSIANIEKTMNLHKTMDSYPQLYTNLITSCPKLSQYWSFLATSLSLKLTRNSALTTRTVERINLWIRSFQSIINLTVLIRCWIKPKLSIPITSCHALPVTNIVWAEPAPLENIVCVVALRCIVCNSDLDTIGSKSAVAGGVTRLGGATFERTAYVEGGSINRTYRSHKKSKDIVGKKHNVETKLLEKKNSTEICSIE